jgi:hypothetical protein
MAQRKPAQRKPAIELHDILPPVQVAKAAKAYYEKASAVSDSYMKGYRQRKIRANQRTLAGRTERDQNIHGTQAPRKTRSRKSR